MPGLQTDNLNKPFLFILVAVGLAALFVALSLAHTGNDDVREYSQAEFIVSDTMPAANDPHWQAVSLPDLWSKHGYVERSGWYRLRIPADRVPEQLQAIYLFRLHMTAAVYFNGELLGDGGRMEEPLARNWNRPLYFNVPRGLWRLGDNELLIHLRTYPGGGMLTPPQIAADELLKPRYQQRQFLQNELSLAFTALLAMVGFYTLGLWLKRKHDSLYLWFALSSFCWSLFNSSLFARYPLFIQHELYQKLTHISLDFWMVFLVGFMHRYLGLQRPRRERFLFLLQGGLALPFLIFPIAQVYRITHLTHAITILLGIYLTMLAWRNWYGKPHVEALSMAAAFSALVLSGLHDWLIGNPIPGLLSWETLALIWRNQFHFLFFMAPLLILFVAWHLTQRFVAALNEAEQLNRELEQRVADKHAELEANFMQMEALTKERATLEERQRIVADMHDGMGAQLVTALRLVESERASRDDIARLLRECLEDLRLVMDSIAPGEHNLASVLANLRYRLVERFHKVGIELDWSIEDIPPLALTPRTALHIQRILQETFANIVKHAKATRIEVATGLVGTCIYIRVADNGQGMVGEHRGRGLTHMRERAARIGGELRLDSSGMGTVVTLLLPASSATTG